MKRLLFLLIASILTVGLVACDDGETKEKEINSVESSNKDGENNGNNEENENDESNNDEAQSEVEDVGEVIADDDYIKATLISVEHVEDATFDEEYYDIKIELENKTEETLEVQAHEVSIDDVMVDDMVFFSETVAGDKKANGVLTIQNYDGDLPTMDDNIEFILNIIDGDSFETIAEHDVKVDF